MKRFRCNIAVGATALLVIQGCGWDWNTTLSEFPDSGDSDTNISRGPDGEADGDVDGDSDVDGDGDTDADVDADSDVDTDTDTNVDADTGETDMVADEDSEERDTGTSTNSDHLADTGADMDTSTDADVDGDNGTDADDGTGTVTDPDANTDTDYHDTGSLDTGTESEFDSESSTTVTERFRVGGTLRDASGTVILQNSTDETLEVHSNGVFIFESDFHVGDEYSVGVLGHPDGQHCSVANATGRITDSDIATVDVRCFKRFFADAVPWSRAATVSWEDINASSYDLFYSATPHFDHDGLLVDGIGMNNATSPTVIQNWQNGTPIYLVVRANFEDNHWALSRPVAARPNFLDETSGKPYTGGGVPLDVETGRVSYRMAGFAIVEGTVYDVEPDGNGGFYIGGSFSRVGGVSRNNIAHILADGSLDMNWAPEVNSAVDVVAVSEGAIYIGSSNRYGFTNVGGMERNPIAAIDMDGSVLLDWNPSFLREGDSGSIYALLVHDDAVYVGGYFDEVNGAPRNCLVALDPEDGSTVDSWMAETGAGYETVYTLSAKNRTIYVGGYFKTIEIGAAIQGRAGIAAISTDGDLKSWSPQLSFDGRHAPTVEAIRFRTDNVFLGGQFFSVNEKSQKYAAEVDIDGELTDWRPEISAAHSVYSMALGDDSVFVSGAAGTISVDGDERYNIAAIGFDGVLLNWSPVSGSMPEQVLDMEVHGDTIYLGGYFLSIGVD